MSESGSIVNSTCFEYRPDVDGLRAISILMVLLFHANFGFSGGFVGVDVFFVISGFLISGLIRKEQVENKFRVSNFVLRRIRRIYPASAFVVFITLAVGWFLLLPNDLVSLANSAIMQQFMVSNVYFWRSTGYFSGSAELKPLLHTWSLGVEEQFYLFFPLLMIALYKLKKISGISIAGGLAVVSFCLSVWGSNYNAQGAFYLLPTRAWELLLGCFLWYLPRLTVGFAGIANTLSILGITGLLWSSLSYDVSTKFPGASALLPCVSAAAIIYGNTYEGNTVRWVLSLKPFVLLGLASYSLYLWHWPVLSFMRHFYCGGNPNWQVRLLAVACSLVLAALTLKLIENPIRRKLFTTPKQLIAGTCVSFALIIGVSYAIRIGNGWPSRFPQLAIKFAESQKSMAFIHEMKSADVVSGPPVFGMPTANKRCLLWGDSHAMALVPGLDAASKSKVWTGFQATHSSTAPLLDFVVDYPYGLKEEAKVFNQSVFDFAVSEHVDVVFLAANWRMYSRHVRFEECLRRTVTKFIDAGIQVVVVKDVAAQHGNVPLVLSMAVRMGQDLDRFGTANSAHIEANRVHNSLFETFADEIFILDLSNAFLDENGVWRAQIDGESMYRDQGHLSVEGSLRLKSLFEEVLVLTMEK